MKKNQPENYNEDKLSNALSPDMKEKRKKYRRQRHIRAGIFLSVSVFSVILIAVFIVAFMRADVRKEIILEAGSEMVSPSDFFERPEELNPVFFMYDNEVDTRIPGVYELKIRNGFIIYNVRLIVEDTVAPTGRVKDINIKLGTKELQPEAFIKDITDETEVTVDFESPVNPDITGDTEVGIVLTDAGGNTTVYTARLTVFPRELNYSLEIEAGTESISVEDFLTEGSHAGEEDKILTEDIDLRKVGRVPLQLIYGGVAYTVTLKIVDTETPGAYIINKETYVGKPIPAEDFVNTLYDETQVRVSYKKKPDFDTPGTKPVTIILEDEGGNKREYSATLYVNKDTVPPIITAGNRTVYIGDNIRFTDGVTAKDNNDGKLEVSVDTGSFDKTKAGRYPITFSATDKAGNTAVRTVYFTLEEKTAETFDKGYIRIYFNGLIDDITDENMTDKEKLRAIYDYIRENIEYTGTSEKSDYMQEAYRGATTKGGDGFTFYAVSRMLITAAGIENKGAERINSDSSHYWNLVRLEGKWYHFDTCPHYKDFPLDSFLLTDKEAEAYSEKTNGYYDYKAFE